MTAPDKDRRLAATEKILKYGVATLVVSVPLVFLAKLTFLPIYIVALAFISIIGVWMFGGKTTGKGQRALESRLSELEQRLANVETISRVERQLDEREGEGESLKASYTVES